VNKFKIIAFTHKTTDLKDIGKFHLEAESWQERFTELKSQLNLEELMYLSTCNRVEFLICTNSDINPNFLNKFFSVFNPDLDVETVSWAVKTASVFEGEEALNHLFEVASSIDSLVVGEREIITQVRNAYDKCKDLQLTGDTIRLVIKHTIETAKEVYTNTNIANKPVSVVSLAYRKLRDLNVGLDARFLIVGAGQTNVLMSKFLKKHGFSNFVVFNRSLDNAKSLASELNGAAYPLTELSNYRKGFDVILTCTAAAEHIISPSMYSSLIGEDNSRKIIIDLSVPNDLDPSIAKDYNVNLIDVSYLQSVANENLQERKKELDACYKIIEKNIKDFRQILKERKVERAMSEVPKKVKEIKDTALNAVFLKDIQQLDVPSKELLDKILNYMEKKYISVPMKMAKSILIEKND